jgi:pimeloyl-ACP methyl ester carboxylesterase
MNHDTFLLPWDDGPTLFLRHLGPTGSQGGPSQPVLYIHGATFPSALSIGFRFDGWSWMDDLAATGFSVWGLDFAGYGGSGRYPAAPKEGAMPPGRAGEAMAQIDRAVRFILAREQTAALSLIAHSWGTMPAARFAGHRPEAVDRLVLFGPIARREGPASDAALAPTRLVTIEEQFARFVEDVPPGHPAVLSRRHFDAWARAYLASDPDSGLHDPPAVRVPNGPVADIRAAWSGTLPYDPSRVTVPTLVVRGAWDSLCDDADARWLLAALASAPVRRDVKITAATHLMHLEQGRFALYEATRSFLAERLAMPA